MKKFLLVLVLFGCVFFVLGAFAADEPVTEKSHFRWEINGTYADEAHKVYCVNDSIVFKFMNHNTRRALLDVRISVYYNVERVALLMTSYTGTAEFVPKKDGVYKLFVQKPSYMDEKMTLNVSSCSVPTTSSSTTSTTGTSTSSTMLEELEEVTTSTFEQDSVTTSTTLIIPPTTVKQEETCSDNIKNQGEQGVDCGGPCKSCSSKGFDYLVLALIAVVVICIILFFYLMKGKGSKHKESAQKDQGTEEHASIPVNNETNIHEGRHRHHHKNHKHQRETGGTE